MDAKLIETFSISIADISRNIGFFNVDKQDLQEEINDKDKAIHELEQQLKREITAMSKLIENCQ